MERDKTGVTNYVSGYATVKVNFPNGNVCCDYCPALNTVNSRVYKCMWLGGQAFASADAQYGVLPNCPIKFDERKE